jgi:hypothetical protein
MIPRAPLVESPDRSRGGGRLCRIRVTLDRAARGALFPRGERSGFGSCSVPCFRPAKLQAILDPLERKDRPDGKINAAGDDHQAHADAEYAVHPDQARHVREIGGAKEARVHGRHDDAELDE